MKLKYQFAISEVGGKMVAVPIWDDKPTFQGVITLNKTAEFIFGKLSDDISEQGLVESVMSRFSCSQKDAQANVDYILKGLREAALLVE